MDISSVKITRSRLYYTINNFIINLLFLPQPRDRNVIEHALGEKEEKNTVFNEKYYDLMDKYIYYVDKASLYTGN